MSRPVGSLLPVPSKPSDIDFMSLAAGADSLGMSRSPLFTNHMYVLAAVAQRPDLRLREIASEVGITERAAHRIITELVDESYLTRTRIGPRNRYEVNASAWSRDPANAQLNSHRAIQLLIEQ